MLPKVLLTIVSYLLVSYIGAGVVFRWWRQTRLKLLPLPRIRWGNWTGGDVVLAYLTASFISVAVFEAVRQSGLIELIYGAPQKAQIVLLWAGPFALPVVAAGIFVALYMISRTHPNDLGVSLARWRANVVLGYVGFVLATPIVLSIFAIFSVLLETKSHDLSSFGEDRSVLPVEWVLLLFSVSVYAPIFEELIFRGLIQGWLPRASLSGHVVLAAIVWIASVRAAFPETEPANGAGTQQEKAAAEPVKDKEKDKDKNTAEDPREKAWREFWSVLDRTSWSRVIATTALVAAYLAMVRRCARQNLFRTEADFLPPLPEEETRDESPEEEPSEPRRLTLEEIDAQAKWREADIEQQRRKAGLAILGSSMSWALAHPTWPDPLALFLLGLVLGWLAQRTQNLLPGVVLHGLFNAVAWLTLLIGQAMNIPQDTNGNKATIAFRPSWDGSIVSSVPASWLPRFR